MLNNIQKLASKFLQREIAGLESLKNLISTKNFEDIIELISQAKGKIIISGLGKSGHIGNKIAATFSSLGISSFFIHPAEANHGDMGMINQGDIMIFISHSGETIELRNIILYCKKHNITSIAITSNAESFIAKNTNKALIIDKMDEALIEIAPAPTTSTTMVLALGDIMAGCVANLKNFTLATYHELHPAGMLGHNFSTIGSLIKKKKRHILPKVNIQDNAKKVILEISSKLYGMTGVYDNDQLVGVISDGDLRRHMGDNILSLTAKDIMSTEPKTLPEDTLVAEAINYLNNYKIIGAFVVDKNNEVIGIIQMYDLITL